MKPGRTRVRLAQLLEQQLGIIIHPSNLQQNNNSLVKWNDLCRWCGTGERDGRFIHIASWDTMSKIVRSGRVLLCGRNDPLSQEVCAGEEVSVSKDVCDDC
jgi:hypothetical protein